MKIKNCNSFIKFALLLLSDDIHLNPGPTSEVCFVRKRTLNKKRFRCNKCDLRAHKKYNNTVILDSDICSDCRRWENLPFHDVSFCTDNSSDTESSMLNNVPSITSHNEVWKVFNKKDMYFGHLNVNSLLSKTERLRTLTFYTNMFLESQKQSLITLLAIKN